MNLILLFGMVFLVLVFLCPVLGANINGARRTIFGLQPSDWIKPVLIVFSAMCMAGGMSMKNEGKEFSWEQGNIMKWRPPKWLWIFVCVSVCAAIGLENGSQAVMIAFTLFCIALMAGVPIKQFLFTFGPIIVILVFFAGIFLIQLDDKGRSTTEMFKHGYLHRFETWYHRVQNVSSDNNPHGLDFDFTQNEQANRGKVAVARGNIWGCGILGNTERSSLPLAFSDFMFASIIEMSGLLGAGVVIFLYLTLFVILVRWALKVESQRNALVLIGVATMITVQAIVNMFVGSGLFVTGQPLPLVSKGGQSMLVCAIMIALCQSIIKAEMENQNNGKKEKPKTVKAVKVE